MPIYLGEKLCKLFRGNYGPASIYKGARKIAGYTEKTKTGSDITFNNSYNDYAKIKASGNTVAEFEPIATTPPTFTRSSTAYKSDGSVVNAGVPRIEEGKGVLVEEGTTNIATEQFFEILANGTGVGSLSSEFMWNGNQSVKIENSTSATNRVSIRSLVPLSGGVTYTFSALIYNPNNQPLSVAVSNYFPGSVVVPANSIGVYQNTRSYEGDISITNPYFTNNMGLTFYVGAIWIEQKAYGTSYLPVNSTRSAEAIAVPKEVLNASEGTIEFDVYFDTIPYSNDTMFFLETRDMEHNSTNSAFTLGIRRTDRRIRLTAGNGNSYDTIFSDASNVINAKEKCRLALRYKNGEYVSVFGKGAKWIQTTNSINLELNAKLLIGSVYSMLSNQPNCFFSNLRISNKARTDEELASTGALSVDEYTTYFAPLTSDLSATKRHWAVYDSAGVLTVSDNASQSQAFTLPTLRKIGSVADEYDLGTGVKTKRISDWVTLDGSKSYGWFGSGSEGLLDTKVLMTPNIYPSADYKAQGYKYDSTPLLNVNYTNADSLVAWSNSRVYMGISNNDSGWSSAYVPSNAECSAYFYGWQMCNSDSTSPYYKSEVPYTPSTWSEWTKSSGVTADSTGVEFTTDTTTRTIVTVAALKLNTKYGYLVNIVTNEITSGIKPRIDNTNSPNTTALVFEYATIGNKKFIDTSRATTSNNKIVLAVYNDNNINAKFKIKDIRIFELPTGSQIEADFTNLTADELSAKYTFNGLCTKYWRKITDLTGLTSVLPTASYEGYTPYKMIYQLATPVTENLGVNTVPTYYPTTSVTTEQTNVAVSTIEVTAKEMDL